MTNLVTVDLPDDVAAYLALTDNASAVVAEALRAQMRRGAAVEAMRRVAGSHITEEDKAR